MFNVVGTYPNGVPETIYRNIEDKETAERMAQEVIDNFSDAWKVSVEEV